MSRTDAQKAMCLGALLTVQSSLALHEILPGHLLISTAFTLERGRKQ